MPYILEVQRFYPDGHILDPEWNGKSEQFRLFMLLKLISLEIVPSSV